MQQKTFNDNNNVVRLVMLIICFLRYLPIQIVLNFNVAIGILLRLRFTSSKLKLNSHYTKRPGKRVFELEAH